MVTQYPHHEAILAILITARMRDHVSGMRNIPEVPEASSTSGTFDPVPHHGGSSNETKFTEINLT